MERQKDTHANLGEVPQEDRCRHCARVGSASSTGGSIFAPGGVTNYTKSWTGSSWNVTWYVCE